MQSVATERASSARTPVAARTLLADDRIPIVLTGLLTAVVALRWVIPAALGSGHVTWDAAGHLSAAQTIRDQFWPWPTGWDPGYFAGWPQGRHYPPLTHWLIAALGKLIPIEAAFHAVVGTAVLATPAAAYRFARGRRASPGSAALFTLFLTTVLAAPPGVLRMENALGGTFHSTYEVGLVTNAVGLVLFLLGGASFPAALARRARLVPAALWLAAGVCNHLVAGAALALLFVGDALARAASTRFPRRVFGRAAATAALGALLAAWWWVPMLFDGGFRRIMHIRSESGPIVPVALALALGAYVVGRPSGPRARLVCAGAGAFAALLVMASAIGDAGKTAAHFYRFAVFAAAGALHVAAVGPGARPARAAAGLLSAALLTAFLKHGGPETSSRPEPPLHPPATLTAQDRVLTAAPRDHQFSAHFLAFQIPRRTGAQGALGLFVESTPLASHFMELSRGTVFDTFTWGVAFDLSRAARLSVEANDPAAVDAATRGAARRKLRELYDLFGITHLVTDRPPPPELVPDPYLGPVVARIPSAAAEESPGFETHDGAFVFRAHTIEPRPAFAESVRLPLVAVPADDKNRWDLAVETRLFGVDQIAELPVAERPGIDLRPGRGAAVRSEVAPDGRRIALQIDAAEPEPVLVKTAWHPNWRAIDAAGAALPVDRVGPGFCLVRAAGGVVLDWRRAWWELATGWISAASLALSVFVEVFCGRAPRQKPKNRNSTTDH
jgi:hypothetical protein